MNLLCRGAIGALVAATLLAGCTGHSPVVPAQTAPVASNAETGTHVVISSGVLASPNACSDPAKFKLCVKRGGSLKVRIEMTCRRDGQPVSCGKVTWRRRISYMRLGATLNPNPGNPTNETVSAAKTAKLGYYTQVVHAHCTVPNIPNCEKDFFGTIQVIQ